MPVLLGVISVHSLQSTPCLTVTFALINNLLSQNGQKYLTVSIPTLPFSFLYEHIFTPVLSNVFQTIKYILNLFLPYMWRRREDFTLRICIPVCGRSETKSPVKRLLRGGMRLEDETNFGIFAT